MKKRILSLVLASVMLCLSSTLAFAAQPISVESAKGYLNSAKEIAEGIINDLKADKDAEIFDQSLHQEQAKVLSDAVETFKAIVSDEDLNYTNAEEKLGLEDAIDLLCEDLSTEQKLYLYSLVQAYDNGDQDYQDAVEAYSTAGLGLKESLNVLDDHSDDYVAGLLACCDGDGISSDIDIENAYNAVASDARKYIAEPLVEALKVVSTTDKEELKENYIAFMNKDRAKKTVAVLLGFELAKEVISEWKSDGEQTKGILRRVKAYIEENPDEAIREIKTAAGTVMVADKEEALDAAFVLFGTMVNKAYKNDALKDKVLKLTGDGEESGLIEKLIKSLREDLRTQALDAVNISFNLFLSEYVQLELAVTGSPLNTICADGAEPVKLSDDTSVNFKLDNIPEKVIEKLPDRFDNVVNMPLPTGWFDVVCYVGGDTIDECEESNYVTYSDGKINIKRDRKRDSEYDAFLVLYRKEADGASTFIESYPVTIKNGSAPTSSGGGSGITRYVLTFETNGGKAIKAVSYAEDTKVELTQIPEKEGYIFAGWYLDKALTQKVDSVVMKENITVYAAWKKDGSSVVSKVDIPELLEGEDHYAYIMGYPEGDIRPMGNITRAETVTMIFRLLKDSVRTANITDENIFSDVNEDDWFNTAVSTLARLGIVEGRTETEFVPNAYITRAEFATLFARLAQYEYVAEDKYGDIDRHWAEDYINEVSAYGWIAGYEDDTFRPDKAINRAEAMTLVNRVLKRVPGSKEDLLPGMTIWTDNTDTNAWYYLAVQEATNSHNYTMKDKSYEMWTELTENRDWTTFEK